MIILYTTNCPRCQVLEAKLKAKGINFEINDNVDEMAKLGLMTAPVLSIGGKLFDFKNAIDWVNLQEDSDEN